MTMGPMSIATIITDITGTKSCFAPVSGDNPPTRSVETVVMPKSRSKFFSEQPIQKAEVTPKTKIY